MKVKRRPGGGYTLLNNGFTLIELLAVIVILAIIALIATPIILNIIERAKTSATIRSAELYLNAVEQAIMRENLKYEFNPSTCTIESDGNLTCDDKQIKIESSGSKPSKGTITLNGGDITGVQDMLLGEYVLETDSKENIVIKGASSEDMEANPEKPELYDTLTPVVYDDEVESWKVVSSTDSSWYNYDEQKWANAVILKSGVTKNPGETVTVDGEDPEALAMLVWIPKYEYKIDTTDGQYGKGSTSKKTPGEIEINFISKNTLSATKGYIIHPAFKFSSKNLSGIWVGKFETTGIETAPTILPNKQSLRNQTLGKQFETALLFNTLYLGSSTSIDTHMAKNSEWGAVTYLSQSKYGKYGNEEFSSTQKEVYKNNSGGSSNGYYTGRSGGNVGGNIPTVQEEFETGESTDQYSDYGYYTYDGYKLDYSGAKTETKEILKGTGASTTGNIYGVYDMSGGSWEYVMSYLTSSYTSDSSKELPWGSATDADYANFTNVPDRKYYDEYTTEDFTTSCANNDICYGQALSETEGWYGDTRYFTTLKKPWLRRGGRYYNDDSAGLFGFTHDTGESSDYYTFRVVLSSVSES